MTLIELLIKLASLQTAFSTLDEALKVCVCVCVRACVRVCVRVHMIRCSNSLLSVHLSFGLPVCLYLPACRFWFSSATPAPNH